MTHLVKAGSKPAPHFRRCSQGFGVEPLFALLSVVVLEALCSDKEGSV